MEQVNVLLLVHFQRDFFGGGAMPLRAASAAVAVVNNLRTSYQFDYVFVTLLMNHPNDECVEGCLVPHLAATLLFLPFPVADSTASWPSQVAGGQQSGAAALAQHSGPSRPTRATCQLRVALLLTPRPPLYECACTLPTGDACVGLSVRQRQRPVSVVAGRVHTGKACSALCRVAIALPPLDYVRPCQPFRACGCVVQGSYGTDLFPGLDCQLSDIVIPCAKDPQSDTCTLLRPATHGGTDGPADVLTKTRRCQLLSRQ